MNLETLLIIVVSIVCLLGVLSLVFTIGRTFVLWDELHTWHRPMSTFSAVLLRAFKSQYTKAIALVTALAFMFACVTMYLVWDREVISAFYGQSSLRGFAFVRDWYDVCFMSVLLITPTVFIGRVLYFGTVKRREHLSKKLIPVDSNFEVSRWDIVRREAVVHGPLVGILTIGFGVAQVLDNTHALMYSNSFEVILELATFIILVPLVALFALLSLLIAVHTYFVLVRELLGHKGLVVDYTMVFRSQGMRSIYAMTLQIFSLFLIGLYSVAIYHTVTAEWCGIVSPVQELSANLLPLTLLVPLVMFVVRVGYYTRESQKELFKRSLSKSLGSEVAVSNSMIVKREALLHGTICGITIIAWLLMSLLAPDCPVDFV